MPGLLGTLLQHPKGVPSKLGTYKGLALGTLADNYLRVSSSRYFAASPQPSYLVSPYTKVAVYA